MAKLDIIRASAGSGKTFKLAYIYIKRLLLNPKAFHEILAVTFTNKATCQMKDRILGNLQKLKEKPENESYIHDLIKDTGFTIEEIKSKASEAQLEILADYNRFSVSTIDKFFTKIVRSFFNELHKDPSYEVVISTNELLDQAIADVILDEENQTILEPIFNKRIEDEKNFDIRQDINTIKNIILYQHPTEYKGLKEQFNQDKEKLSDLKEKIIDAAKQITGYMFMDNLNITDYLNGLRGFANNIDNISKGIKFDIGKGLLTVYKGGPLYSKTCAKKSLIDKIENRLRIDIATLINAIDKYTYLNNSIDLINKNINLIEVIKVIHDKFRQNCERDHLVSINEMPKIVSDIANNENLDFLYMKIDARLRSIMIDEFQDTSLEQWDGFRPILDEICSYLKDDESVNLIIGDIKQAIYRWRGGNEALLRKDVADQFSEFVQEESLNKNYRSRKKIIEFNNELFERIKTNGIDSDDIKFDGKEEVIRKINNLIRETYSDSTQLVGTNSDGGYVKYMTVPEDDSVPGHVINIIKDEIITKGYSYKDIAVIIRNNRDSYDIADEFSKTGIPFISGESLCLANSKIVHQFMTLLHLSVNTDDILKIADYNISMGLDIMTPLDQNKIDILKSIPSLPLIETAALILDKLLPDDTSDETAFLDAFLNILFERQTIDDMSVTEFIEWWDNTGYKTMLSSPDGQNAVTIITIHKSKGLEYPVVIAPRMDWNIFNHYEQKYLTADDGSDYAKFGPLPVSLSQKCYNSIFKSSYLAEREQEIIDNLNLLYVLTTRAKDRLYMISQEKAKNKISNILRDAINVDYEYGDKDDCHIEEKRDEERKETIENINPIRFKKALSKSSSFIESGNYDSTNLMQGILMHKVLSTIDNLSELDDAVRKQCDIESIDYEQFRPIIDKILSKEEMKIWFSSKWKSYRERGIFIPGNKPQKRPDRVIVNDNEAIVIDYKFGRLKLEKHLIQTRDYMKLVSQMGYRNVSGYVYYVNLDEIEVC